MHVAEGTAVCAERSAKGHDKYRGATPMVTRKGAQNDDKPTLAEGSRTLHRAHEVLSRLRPERNAPLAAWEEYHRQSANVYAEIAEIDRHHHHEALYWAQREREKADEFADQMAAQEAATGR